MIPNRKWSPKWTANDPRPQVIPKSTANDPQRKIGMASTQVSGWSCQFYYYKTSDLKRNFTSQINTWIKTIWKNSFKCKQATHVLPECCLFQWIFSAVGRLCSGGKRFGWANVIFAAYISYWEVMTHILIFCGYCFWSTWLPFGARAFPLTSFEMQCSSLQLNKGFRLFNCFPKCLLDPNNYKQFSFSRWMWRFPTMFCHAIITALVPRFCLSHFQL